MHGSRVGVGNGLSLSAFSVEGITFRVSGSEFSWSSGFSVKCLTKLSVECVECG